MCEWGTTIDGIDACIATLIAALNRAGLETVASCCGHGHRPGRISLRDGRELFILANYKMATKFDKALNKLGFPDIQGRSMEGNDG